MLVIQKTYPREIYEATWKKLFDLCWIPEGGDDTASTSQKSRPALNPSLPDDLSTLLLTPPHTIPEPEIQKIFTAAQYPEYKTRLADQTKWLVEETGAFGCPWILVTRPSTGETKQPDPSEQKYKWIIPGQREPFFGSDRWGHIWKFLGLRIQKEKVLAKDDASNESVERAGNEEKSLAKL